MNYFAHGRPFLDRPYFVAGTALPDWLSVVDRRVRLRARFVEPFAAGEPAPAVDLAAGVLQHLRDDAWFHATPAFAHVSAVLSRRFRMELPADDDHRPGFLGHILTEMLLDAVLIDREPARLDAYYDVFRELDPHLIERAVNSMARVPTERLAHFIPLFHRERFLADYQEPSRLLVRLNQILRRVKLAPLPAGIESLLREARSVVEDHAVQLLPGESDRSNSPHQTV